MEGRVRLNLHRQGGHLQHTLSHPIKEEEDSSRYLFDLPTQVILGGSNSPCTLNRFFIVALTFVGGLQHWFPHSHMTELLIGEKAFIGRASHPEITNRHISRKQVEVDISRAIDNKFIVSVRNLGKNSTRIISPSRRKQARILRDVECRIVPGDIIELLYDTPGCFAFELIEVASDSGSPLIKQTPLAESKSAFVPAPLTAAESLLLQPDVSPDFIHCATMALNSALDLFHEVDQRRIVTEQVIFEAVSKLIEMVPTKRTWRQSLSSAVSADKGQNWVPPDVEIGFAKGVLMKVAEGFAAYLLESDDDDQMMMYPLPSHSHQQMRRSSGSGIGNKLILGITGSSLIGTSRVYNDETAEEDNSSSTLVSSLSKNAIAPLVSSSSVHDIRELHRSSKQAPNPLNPILPSVRSLGNDAKEMDVWRPEDKTQAVAADKYRLQVEAFEAAEAARLRKEHLSFQIEQVYRASSSVGGAISRLPIAVAPVALPVHHSHEVVEDLVPSRVFRSATSGRPNDAVEEWDEQDALEAAALEGQGYSSDEDEDNNDEDEEEEEEEVVGVSNGGRGRSHINNKNKNRTRKHERVRSGSNSHRKLQRRSSAMFHRFASSSESSISLLQSKGKKSHDQVESTELGALITQDCPTPPLVGTVQASKGPPSSADFHFLRQFFDHDDPMDKMNRDDNNDLIGEANEDQEQPSSSLSTATINSIPMAVIGMILSYLPLPEIVRAGRVSKEWRHEVRSANSISVIDFGSIFAGSTAPDAKLFDKITKSVRGRDYSFANCTWLTTGALLHAIGVPFSITSLAPMPPLAKQPGTAGEAARHVLASEVSQSLSTIGDGPGLSDALRSLPLPISRTGASHSYSRLFLGESLDAELSIKENIDAGKPPFPISHSQLTRAASPLGGGPQRWWHLVGPLSSSWIRNATSDISTYLSSSSFSSSFSSSSSLSSLSSSASSATIIKDENETQHSSSPSIITILELSLGLVNSEVIRSRAFGMQRTQFQVVNAVEDPKTEKKRSFHADVYSTIAARAYVEMWLSLRSILYTHTTAISRSLLPPSSELFVPLPLRYNLLTNSKSLVNSHSVIASSDVFEPCGTVRRKIAAAAAADEAQTKSQKGSRRSGFGSSTASAISAADIVEAEVHMNKLTKELGNLVINVSADVAAKAFSEVFAMHSLSVAYGTAAGDMFTYSMLLADEEKEKALSSQQYHTLSSHTIASPQHSLSYSTSSTSLSKLNSNFCSFDLPAPIMQLRNLALHTSLKAQSKIEGEEVNHPRTMQENIFGEHLPSLPPTFVSHVTGLDLHGCVRLAPQNFSILLRYCPHISVLQLAGCNQLSSGVLVASLSLVPKLKQLDLDYISSVDDQVLAAIGRHCPLLTRLQLIGCTEITDTGMSATGLFNQCTKLRRLNVRGCDQLTDSAIKAIAHHLPQLRELGLSGLTKVSGLAIATLVLSCRKLKFLKAELWFDSSDGTHPPARPEDEDDENPDKVSKRSFRILGTVRGAIKYIQSILPPNDPLIALLQKRQRELHVPAGWSASGAGMPIPVESIISGIETSEMMTPAMRKRRDDANGESATASPVGSVNMSFFAEIPGIIEASLGPGTVGDILLRDDLARNGH
jgi:hypothetical protein